MNSSETSHNCCQAANIGFQFAGAVRALNIEDSKEDKDEDVLQALRMQIDGLGDASLACKIASPIGAVHMVTQIGASISNALDSFPSEVEPAVESIRRQLQATLVGVRQMFGWVSDHFEIDSSVVASDYCIERL